VGGWVGVDPRVNPLRGVEGARAAADSECTHTRTHTHTHTHAHARTHTHAHLIAQADAEDGLDVRLRHRPLEGLDQRRAPACGGRGGAGVSIDTYTHTYIHTYIRT
jgi:hypothetical protein